MQTKEHIIEKYGGEAYLKAPPKSLLLAQTEDYIEYSRSGKVIKGMEKQKARSIYEEDVYHNNHTTVWGSYWLDGHWGYKCCKSLIKNSYCIGLKDPDAEPSIDLPHPEVNRSSDDADKGKDDEKSSDESSSSSASTSQESSDSESSENSSASGSSTSSSSTSKSKKMTKKKKKKKKEEKIAKVEKRQKEQSCESSKKATNQRDLQLERFYEDTKGTGDSEVVLDDRKRPYNSMNVVVSPTEDEMEEWKRKRVRAGDPMAEFMTK